MIGGASIPHHSRDEFYATEIFHNSAFNKVWNAKLEAKRVVEADAEKAAKAKAKEDMSNWTAQRDIRLHAKKVFTLAQ